ncbi:Gfo/Idh/MocA family oxidoreductase [Neobacillus sp. PS3-34]|uniref:Gfo/Idh/MocA family protein n=1 Tax=Neobacillus sp. PS3-34 TaxID=3070678 RepID=UPI0027E17C2F|nr:Gfo/Idh/MocA family oxidoreductase [Neobacillus sp. PS3-34]WML49077.1 Gfo/Idh/MocA family oxidoreductase [Neobacillus sp. PS3-34]
MIRVAILSFWHVHAKDYANDAINHPDTEITAVWDELPSRGREAANQLGVPFIKDLDELMQNPDIDAVIVTTPTNMHHDVMVKAAKAGKHIFTEKVIAPTIKEANEIIAAVQETGIKLTVSLPRLNDSYTFAVQNVIREGLLGELTFVRVRVAHNGAIAGWLPEHFYNLEQCGGGALIDLGCHPVYLTRLFLGMPESVSASYGYITGKEVEDNAIAVFRYANGSIGIAETSFVNSHSPFTIEVHGTEGTLMYGTPEPKMLIRSTKNNASTWEEITLPPSRESAFCQWIDHIQNGTVAEENITLALDLTKLMEASNLSVKEQRSILIREQ